MKKKEIQCVENMSEDSDEKPSTVVDRRRDIEEKKQERAAREQMLRIIFTSEARERLNTIKIVKPELAEMIENQIFQLASSGKLKRQIDDDELKTLLGQMQKPRREFKINYK